MSTFSYRAPLVAASADFFWNIIIVWYMALSKFSDIFFSSVVILIKDESDGVCLVQWDNQL